MENEQLKYNNQQKILLERLKKKSIIDKIIESLPNECDLDLC